MEHKWFYYTKKYYLTHPFAWLSDVCTGIKNARLRRKRNFDWVALWNMDNFLLTLIPEMLRELEKNACGCPCDEEFPNMDVYREWMRALATVFEIARDLTYEFKPDTEAVRARIEAIPESEYPVIGELKREALEATEYGDVDSDLLEVAFKHLARNLRTLWD